MMKRLLSMAVAAVFAVGAYAQDYVYTSTQKLKITGDNIVTNGNFAEGTTGWVAADGGDVNATIWTLESGVGPAGENALKSLGNEAADANALCQRWAELSGTYVITLQMKGTAYTNTAIGAAQNSVDFFLNTDGAYVKAASTEEAPVVNVAAASYFAEDWTTLTFVANIEAGQFLVMNIQQLATDAMVTNIQIRPAEAVYDTRGVEQTIAFAKKLMDDANFNTEAAAAKRGELAETIELVEGMLAAGMLDDESTALAYVEILNTVFGEYMDVTAVRVNSMLTGTETSTLANTGKINRGDNNGLTRYFPNLELTGGSWRHDPANCDYIWTGIQKGFHNDGTYNVFHVDFPAGKYFFTGSIRNANTDKNTVLSWNLETTCKIFVGKDSAEVGPIVGEQYQKFYIVGNVDEDGKFRAGFEWPGVEGSNGGAFYVRDVEVRSFSQNISEQVEHIQAYKAYKAQWDAAVSAQKKVRDLTNDPNYPWGQDSLARASVKWDPYVESHRALNWQNADGTDANVATTEQLNDWAKYQGVEEYNEPTEENPEPTRKEYLLVRGFQYAASYVIDRNKPFTDLANAIDDAKKTRNNAAYATGDRETYKTAILNALNTITSVRAATTNATFEADSTTIAQAKETLDAATKAFIASVTIDPIIDIDFDSEVGIQEVTVDETAAYVYNGTKGQMVFSGTPTLYEKDGVKPATTANQFNIGHRASEDADLLVPGVLRVANGTATVAIAEADQPSETDVIQFTFDLYFGNLSGRNTYVELRNAANERVAGFSLNRYNGSVAYNEFNDVLTNGGTGMNLLKYATGVGSSSAANDKIADASNKSSFELVVDYKNQTVKGVINNAKNGRCEGTEYPFSSLTSPAMTSGDTKITQFVVGSNYNNVDRRSWFDNLRVSKYGTADFEEDITQSPWAEIPDGIQAIGAEKGANNAIYTLSGVKVTNASKPGIYILNGKKFVVK